MCFLNRINPFLKFVIMEKNLSAGPRKNIDVRLLGTAIDVVNDKTGGKFSMEILRSMLETTEFKNHLLKCIEETPELKGKYHNADAAVNALQAQLDLTEKILVVKEKYIEKAVGESSKDGVLKKIGKGIWKVATHPIVLTALLGGLAWWLLRRTNEARELKTETGFAETRNVAEGARVLSQDNTVTEGGHSPAEQSYQMPTHQPRAPRPIPDDISPGQIVPRDRPFQIPDE